MIKFTPSLGRLRQKIVPKSMPHVQHDYFSLFNQSFVALSLLSSFLKVLLTIWETSLPENLEKDGYVDRLDNVFFFFVFVFPGSIY